MFGRIKSIVPLSKYKVKKLVNKDTHFYMHEHINFFTKKSLVELIKQQNYQPLLINVAKWGFDENYHVKVLTLVARKQETE